MSEPVEMTHLMSGDYEAALNEVRRNVDHGEAQYNPWALLALRVAEGLQADYHGARREIAELKAARAAEAAERDRALAEVASLTAERDRLRAEAAFWQDQQKFAANVAAGIADLDEEAPALRQMLRVERGRRKDAEKEGDSRGYKLERQRPVIEAARALVGYLRDVGKLRCSAGEIVEKHLSAITSAVDALDGAPGEATP